MPTAVASAPCPASLDTTPETILREQIAAHLDTDQCEDHAAIRADIHAFRRLFLPWGSLMPDPEQ